MCFKLTKPLDGAGRMIANDATSLAGTVLDPGLKETGIGAIVLPVEVVTTRGREKLWPHPTKEPRFDPENVDTPWKTDRVLVPHVEGFDLFATHSMLPTILHKANRVIRAVQAMEEGKAKPSDLQVSVNRYYDCLVEELAGKDGLPSRNVLGVRAPNSARFVIVPDPALGPLDIGVPLHVMYEADINTGDYLIVTRSPVLWEGSVLVLQATKCQGMAGHLNPYVMGLLGADFDGDTVAVARIPKDDDVMSEVADKIGVTIEEHARWDAEFLMFDHDTKVKWDKPDEDVANRLQVGGYLYSLSPKDVLQPSESEILGIMEESGCKSPPQDLSHYARGVSERDFAETAQNVVAMTIRMKVELGVVGALTDMIAHAIYVIEPELLRTALALKEAVTQALLDSKHGTDSFDTFRVADVFKRQDRWHPNHKATAVEAVSFLTGCGISTELAEPVVVALWPHGEGVSAVAEECMSTLMLTRRMSRRFVLALKDGQVDKGFMGRLLNVYPAVEHTKKGDIQHVDQ